VGKPFRVRLPAFALWPDARPQAPGRPLGFGYHPTNLSRLKIPENAQAAGGWSSTGGTALGLEDAEIRSAEKLMDQSSGFLKKGEDCLIYLRRHLFTEPP
jgi:hypothetical protein